MTGKHRGDLPVLFADDPQMVDPDFPRAVGDVPPLGAGEGVDLEPVSRDGFEVIEIVVNRSNPRQPAHRGGLNRYVAPATVHQEVEAGQKAVKGVADYGETGCRLAQRGREPVVITDRRMTWIDGIEGALDRGSAIF